MIEKNEIVNLLKSADVEAGKTFIQTLYRNQTTTVSWVRFEGPWPLDQFEERAQERIVYVIEGVLTVSFDSSGLSDVSLSKGDITVLPRNVGYKASAAGTHEPVVALVVDTHLP